MNKELKSKKGQVEIKETRLEKEICIFLLFLFIVLIILFLYFIYWYFIESGKFEEAGRAFEFWR